MLETNEKVAAAKSIMTGLRKDGILTDKPFQTPIDFAYFDLLVHYVTAAPRSTARSWAAPTSCNGNGNLPKYPGAPHRPDEGDGPKRCAGNMPSRSKWYADHRLWLEAFVLVNVAFLSLDIYLAHSVNQFRRWPEYIPLLLSRWPTRRWCW